MIQEGHSRLWIVLTSLPNAGGGLVGMVPDSVEKAACDPPACTGECLSACGSISSRSGWLRLLRLESCSARATSRDRDWSLGLPLCGSSGSA
jgi:hypothetical protein